MILYNKNNKIFFYNKFIIFGMYTNGNRDFFKSHLVNGNNKYKKVENVDKVQY